jgi:hypothetical protein
LELARLAAASFVETHVSAVRFDEIQAGGVAIILWPAGTFRDAPRSLHLLQAKVLLVNFLHREC